jgi:hypothetical protein
MTYLVTVYLDDKAYGGPEEGGWYFNCGQPLKDVDVGFKASRRFKNEGQAVNYARRLNARLHRLNVDRPSISSVASEGIYCARVTATKPQPYPRFRPHYE